MSNRVTLEPTTFVNVRTGHVTYGYRAHDDYGQTYYNCWDSIPGDNLALLALAIEDADDFLTDMLSYVVENEKGITIGDNYYSYEEIKHLF